MPASVQQLEGIIVVNKPSGITSHDVVKKVRARFGIKRVGHAGTLDPLATGVLVILLGRSTKLFDQFVDFDKGYKATLILGIKTRSADIQGEILNKSTVDNIALKKIENAFYKFTGEIDQVPPMVSAVKYKGKRLYQLAREGIEVKRKARRVKIYQLDILNVKLPEVVFSVECSKGTYVRQLGEDIGDELGCGACISQIERTRVGAFDIQDAVNIEDINESHIRNWQS